MVVDLSSHAVSTIAPLLLSDITEEKCAKLKIAITASNRTNNPLEIMSATNQT
jgi:hypothetical protein